MKKSLHLRFMSAAMLMGFACAASAANQTVTDAAGLKAAIAQAENGDVITVNGTIMLDEQIDISNKIVTIEGGTLDGQNKTLIFKISDNSQVTLNDMTFQNAFHDDVAGQEKGGAIRIQGGNLNVYDCTFTNNHVTYDGNGGATEKPTNWDGGGAIHAVDAMLDVQGTTFQGNSGFHGGAIGGQNSQGSFYDCVFEDNEAICTDWMVNNTDDGRGGGAVFARWDSASPKKFEFKYCKFINNSCKRTGGAICLVTGADAATADYENNVFTIEGCVFDGNHTLTERPSKDCRGGAIEIAAERAATVNILSSTFTNNVSTNNGGAIDFFAEAKESATNANGYVRVNIVNCTVTGNRITSAGGGNGGGIYIGRKPMSPDGSKKLTEVNVINTIIAGNKGVNAGAEVNSDFRIQIDGGSNFGRSIKNLRNCLIRDLNDQNRLPESDINYEGTKCGNAGGKDYGIESGLLDAANLFGEMVDGSYFPLKAGSYAATNPIAGADDLAKEYGLEYDQLGQLLNKDLVGAVSLIEGETPSTGIDDDVVAEEVENTDDSYYTLSGVRISKPSQPGIYIHKGKKIVIR